MAWLDDGGMRGAGCQRCGAFRGRWVEWAVTALFIQRLNSLEGEAEKCQREEDDYERYRSPSSFPEKKTLLLLLLHLLLVLCLAAPRGLIPQMQLRGGGARGTMLCLSHSSFSRPHAGSASPLQQYR